MSLTPRERMIDRATLSGLRECYGDEWRDYSKSAIAEAWVLAREMRAIRSAFWRMRTPIRDARGRFTKRARR